MVDALRRARAIVKRSGCIVDLHPTADHAVILVGDRVAGEVDTGNAPQRHQAATDALAAAARDGLVIVDDSTTFLFRAYADSIEELQDHILEDWREGRIGEATLAAARTLMQSAPGVKPCVQEHVSISRLRIGPESRRSPSSTRRARRWQ